MNKEEVKNKKEKEIFNQKCLISHYRVSKRVWNLRKEDKKIQI